MNTPNGLRMQGGPPPGWNENAARIIAGLLILCILVLLAWGKGQIKL